MHRFYCPHTDLKNDTIIISQPSEVHHLKDVLRLTSGKEIEIFDGKGTRVVGTIQKFTDSGVAVKVQSLLPANPKQYPFISLACAIPKKAKFENIIEKCTELGVDEIIPILTERTEIKLERDRLRSKSARYQAVAVNASKQSKRDSVPIIQPITPFKETLKSISVSDTAIIPCLVKGNRQIVDLARSIPRPSRVIIFIGPEGDFSPSEVTAARNSGCVPVSLGDTVLKVDTAAITVTVLAKYLFLFPNP